MNNDIDMSTEEHLGETGWVSNGVCGSALEFKVEDDAGQAQASNPHLILT